MLPAVIEASESQSSLSSSYRDNSDALVILKNPVHNSVRKSLFNIVRNKKEPDSSITNLKPKSRQAEHRSDKSFNKPETLQKASSNLSILKKKIDMLMAEPSQSQNLQDPSSETSKTPIEPSKSTIFYILHKSKIKLHKKNSPNKLRLHKAKEFLKNPTSKKYDLSRKSSKTRTKSHSGEIQTNTHLRARSALSYCDTENQHQSLLLHNIKHQQLLLDKLGNLAKEDENISIQQKRDKILLRLNNNKIFMSREKRTLSQMRNRSRGPLIEIKSILNC